MAIIENENGLTCYLIRNSVIRLSLVVVYEYIIIQNISMNRRVVLYIIIIILIHTNHFVLGSTRLFVTKQKMFFAQNRLKINNIVIHIIRY